MPRPRPITSLHPDRIRGRRRWLVVLTILVIIVAASKACSSYTGQPNPVDRAITAVTSPVARGINRLGEGIASLRYVFAIPSLLRENQQLMIENDTMERQLAETESLRQENQRLRVKLGTYDSYLKLRGDAARHQSNGPEKYQVVPARVIARPYDLWLESVIINAGKSDGVTEGCLVANERGVVGKVTEVQGSTCRVMLISSPEFSLGAVSVTSRDESLVHGVSAGEMKLHNILVFDLQSGSTIAVGENVFTRGAEPVEGSGTYQPRGLYLGKVTERVADQSGFLKVTIEPAANVNRLDHVVVYKR